MIEVPANEVQIDQPQPVNDNSSQLSSGQEVPASEVTPDAFQSSEDKYGSTSQQLISGLEGAGRSATFGLSSGIEKALGVPEEDIVGRQKENPISAGVGEVAGALGTMAIGVGEGAVLAKAGNAAAEFAGFGKLGSAIVRGAIETTMFQGGDEISKAMLGQGDPEAPVSSALAHIGAATLFGSATGGVLGLGGLAISKTADALLGSRIAQLAEDFGNAAKFDKEVENPAKAIAEELNHFHETILGNGKEAFSLKKDVADKLLPKTSEAVDSQMKEIGEQISTRLEEASTKNKTKNAVPFINDDVGEWQKIVNDSNSTAADKFVATNDLKKALAAYANFRQTTETTAAGILGKDLSSMLIPHLENSKVWGEIAGVQKELNHYYNTLNDKWGPLKTVKMFMDHEGNGEVPSFGEGKIQTFLNQFSKESSLAIRKNNVLSNYIKPMTEYQEAINNVFNKIGAESPIQPSSLNTLHTVLNMPKSYGTSLFNLMKNANITSKAVEVGATAIGNFPGYIASKAIGPIVEKAVGRSLNDASINAVLKVMGSGAYQSAGEALAHANNVLKGSTKITNAIDGIFSAGNSKALDFIFPENHREKLRDFVEKGGLPKQIQNTLNKQQEEQSTTTTEPPQRFAEGGIVKANHSQKPSDTTAANKLSLVYPDQDMLLHTAKSRIYNYLNSQRPQENAPKLPFDSKMEDKQKQKEYNNVLDMANQPLSILKHVKQGTLTADQMRHFNQMYPELYGHLSKKMTEKIMEQSHSEEKPPYHVRQALSLFLGAPLDSSFTPASVQAAQSVFIKQGIQKQQQMQAEGKSKRGTSGLSNVHNQYLTDDQGRIERQAKG